MPSTFISKENFPSNTSENNLKEEIKLRLKAGAIKSWYEKESSGWVLYTEWNVIGE